MVFHNFAKRKLRSVLSPWLREEPAIELKLGVINSHATLQNLKFDAVSLNRLIDESNGLRFDDVTIDELRFQFSNWNAPALTVEISGVHVSVSVRGRRCTGDACMEDTKKKVISTYDPEGSAIHEVLERISVASTSRTLLTTSFWNLVFSHCHLVVHDIDFQVQSPLLNNSISFFLKLKELNAESQFVENECLFRCLFNALFLPEKDSSLTIDGSGFGLCLKRKDDLNYLCTSSDLSICIKLNELQFEEFCLCIPGLCFSLSVADLQVLVAFCTILSPDSKHARNGRQLWKLAASRISHVVSSPQLLLHRVTNLVLLWLRYVTAYEYLLALVGYSFSCSLEGSLAKVHRDKTVLGRAKQQFRLLSDMEKALPAELIAQGRQVGRYRVAVLESTLDRRINYQFYCVILLYLSYLWKLICRVFHLVVPFLFFRKLWDKGPVIDGDGSIVPQDPHSQCSYILNLRKVVITIRQVNTLGPSVVDRLRSQVGDSFSILYSFVLSIDKLLLVYEKSFCKQSLLISSGELKVDRVPYMESPGSKEGSYELVSSREEYQRGAFRNGIETILWFEPIESSLLLESRKSNSHESSCDLFLEELLRDMFISWKKVCMNIEENETEIQKTPFLLGEIKHFMTYPGLKSPDSGFSKFSLVIGKLNLDLDFASLLSISLLFGQMQHAFNKDSGTTIVQSHSEGNLGRPEQSWNSLYKSFSCEVKMALLRMLPERHIQVGLLLAGPHILLSLRKEGCNDENIGMECSGGQNDFHLAFDVQNIEIAVSPTLKFDFLSLSELQGLGDQDSDSLRLKDLQNIDIPGLVCGNYISRGEILFSCYLKVYGVCAYLGDSAKSQGNQILVLKPVCGLFSSSRKYVRSLGTSGIALSAAFGGKAGGLTVFWMEDLMIFLQVIMRLHSQVSHTLISIDPNNSSLSQEYAGEEAVFSEFNYLGTTARGSPSSISNTLIAVDGDIAIKSIDLILHGLRFGNDTRDHPITFDSIAGKRFAEHGLLDCGLLLSLRGICLEVSFKDRRTEVLLDISGTKSIIFKYQETQRENANHSVDQDLLLESSACLYETSISDCSFALWLDPAESFSYAGNRYNIGSESEYEDNRSCLVKGNASVTDSESSNARELVASNAVMSASSHWLLINVRLGDIYMGSCFAKKALLGAHQLSSLTSSLNVGGQFQTIYLALKGGIIFFDTTAFYIFSYYVASFRERVKNICSSAQQTGEESCRVDVTELSDHVSKECAVKTVSTSQVQWELIEALNIHMSEISLILVTEDESGNVRELVLELDIHSELQSTNIGSRFLLDLTRLSVLSQFLHANISSETQTPHFSSSTSKNLPSYGVLRDHSVSHEHEDEACSVNNNRGTKQPNVKKKFILNNDGSEELQIIHQNCILESLSVFIAVSRDEKVPLCPDHAWVGSGSLSGFDMTISISELQMMFSVVAPFSAMKSEKTASELRQSQWSSDKKQSCKLEAVIPDGAIVAIQDVQQHMYFSVEGGEGRYSLSGANHYSLVGGRALFRVKYYKPRMWKSPILWFSLLSLHAKNNSGEPLRLNCRPGSGFVDISGTNDSGSALWRAFPFEPESVESDIDWEPYNQSFKNTFYLVNRKNDSAVAFIDKVPEFVQKPGNPFKLKVFHNSSFMQDVGTGDCENVDSLGINLLPNLAVNEQRTAEQSVKVPWVHFTIDRVSLTIVHELLDTRDVVPLLQLCLSDTQCPVQIISTKTRVIITSRIVLLYFDAQRNLWSELIHPVEMCIFYRYCFQIPSTQTKLCKFPVYFHCKTTEFNIYISQLSLDILLFLVGELNLAGPYSLRSSVILANCCKVENRSGSNVLCQFQKNQSIRIAREQSASIFLRHSRRANQPPESVPVVSLQLSALGSFTTASIEIPLLESRTLSWRTRIMSLQDSKTYPGPFVVVDISNKSEDGLLVVVSPLIQIRNETKFPMEFRFQRPQQMEDEVASVLLKSGDMMDDSMATFDAINSSGGLKKALLSLSVGNFLFSFRPEVTEYSKSLEDSVSVEWSDNLKGGKAVRLTGIFDKLSYKVRKALSVESAKCLFSTASCTLKSKDASFAKLHFLIQSIERDVPVVQPDKSNDGNGNSPIALQQQKEIFLLPTVQVSNLLHTDIDLLLTETDRSDVVGWESIGKKATISSGSTVDFYANPAIMYFIVTIPAFNAGCKPVNSGDWAKKLRKQKNDVHHLDIDLDFGGGKYFASLRLSRGHTGTLEAVIFTSYAIKNDSDFSLLVSGCNQKSPRWDVEKFDSNMTPELGLLLSPKTTGSWFLKSNKVNLKLLSSNAPGTVLDLDALSGLTEISLEMDEGSGSKYVTNFGASVGPSWSKMVVPSQTVTMVPRYVVHNESKESVIIRQCYLGDDMEGTITVSSKQREILQLRNEIIRRREFSLFENIIRKHKSENHDSVKYIQFRPGDPRLGWSGPLCITSLGRFFLKFRKQQLSQVSSLDENNTEFAAVHVVEEGSTVVLHFHKPPNSCLPYRIENYLRDSSLTYYQKDSSEPEILGSGCTVDYVWDDLTLPRKLVVQINDIHLLREINLDKVRAWKPFSKIWQRQSIASHLFLDKGPGDQRPKSGEIYGMDLVKVGYEVYADGPTRVLRVCRFSDSHKEMTVTQSCSKIRLRVPNFAFHLLEREKQDMDNSGQSVYTPLVVAWLGNISLDSVLSIREKYTQLSVQSLNVEPKWIGAPFAATIRRHLSDNSNLSDSMFRIALVLLSNNSSVTQVRYSSIVLQPIHLNLDEETLMRIAPFWRSSLSSSTTRSREFYFDHFEIHPIKIIANFLPGESYSSYSSAQETLRSLLHSIIKVPPIKNMVVELNGVLVTHALITTRELLIRCTQHYSWYAMRAISLAKGSSLLPPDFASMFDDLASSSLDVFFDPAHGLNIPGFTLGTFKLISKCVKGRGISGTKRYFGDLGKTLRTAGSNALFAAVTEVSDSVLKGAEASGFKGMVSGFHQGILRLAMEPSLLGTALMEGGPDRKIKLDRSPGVDELYIEGYLQAMLDTLYKQEYLRVRVIDDEVFLKNLPPNSSLIEEIIDRVKSFLVSKALLKGDPSTNSRPLRHLRGESEWKIGPTILTLCEHLFVSFSIRILRKQTGKYISGIKWKTESKDTDPSVAVVPANSTEHPQKVRFRWKWGIGKFIFSGLLAYIDGRLCRCIPNTIARRIVSGFLLSFIDKNDDQ